MIAVIVAFAVRVLLGPAPRHLGALAGTRPRVFFANHSSHLDFLVIWALLPADIRRHVHPVAARDYWSQGRVRRFIAGRFFGGLMIERRGGATTDNPVEQMAAILQANESLILFPEGTRGTGDAVQPFRAGLFHLYDANPEVEFVPVFLENLNRILPKGEFLPVPLLSYVTFGAPLARLSEETKDAFLDRARSVLVGLETS